MVCREPEPHQFLNNLIGLARSFRWDILEWSLSELNSPFKNQQDKVNVFDRLKESLLNVEISGEERGMRLAEVVKYYFPIEDHENIEKSYNFYWSNKAELLDAIEENNIGSIIKTLQIWQKINKDFLLMAVNRYLEEIKKLTPMNLQ